MLNKLKKLNFILSFSKINLYSFFLILFLNSFFELISIGILIPTFISIFDNTLLDKIRFILINQDLIDLNFITYLEKKKLLLALIFIMSFILFLKYFINLLFIHVIYKKKFLFETKVSNIILKNIFNSYSTYSLNFSKAKILNSIINRISNLSNSILYYGNFFLELLILLLLTIIFFYNFELKAIYILSLISTFFFIFYFFLKKKISKWGINKAKYGDLKARSLNDLLDGIREILIFRKYDYLLNEFNLINKVYIKQHIKFNFWKNFPRIFIEFSIILFLLLFFLYVVIADIKISKSFLSELIIYLVITFRAVNSIYRLLSNYSNIKFSDDSLKEVFQLLNQMNYKIYKKKINFDKKINLKNINFKVNNFCIFKNLNLTIKKDLKLAIVGKSGIGKSTLLDLITGLKFPDSGKIFIDKKILSIKFSHSWIDNFSYVSQKTFMFNSSVRSNITFEADNKNIDINKFNESIKVSNLKNFLNLKLEKEFFLISEYGKNLSGGQIQQIGIARAIYANRPIIIFDESINALDSINKNIIINNLLSLKNKTIILITHSADNIKKFNEVYEIKNKTISQIK